MRPVAFFTALLAIFQVAYGLKHPVVMIPGLAGSVIKMKLDNAPAPHYVCSKNADWFVAWVNLEEIVQPAKDCLLARLNFTFDQATGLYHDVKGVSIDANVNHAPHFNALQKLTLAVAARNHPR